MNLETLILFEIIIVSHYKPLLLGSSEIKPQEMKDSAPIVGRVTVNFHWSHDQVQLLPLVS